MKLLLQVYVEDPAQQYKNEDVNKRFVLEDFIKTYFDVSDDFDYDELFAKPMYGEFAHVLDENIVELAKPNWFERLRAEAEVIEDVDVIEDSYRKQILPEVSGDYLAACSKYNPSDKKYTITRV